MPREQFLPLSGTKPYPYVPTLCQVGTILIVYVPFWHYRCPIEIRAKMREQKRNFVIIDISLTAGGVLCSVAEATYYCFPREKAEKDFHFLPYEVEE